MSDPAPAAPAVAEAPAVAAAAAPFARHAAGVVVSGVSKSFDGTTVVLDGVDVAVADGATLALLGPSGCGKTTLLRIVAGLETADAGTVVVGDRTLTGPDVLVAPEHRRIGMVFQDWALFPHLSVARNVGFGLPRAERKVSPRIDEALELVGLAGLGERSPSTLSGGQQQRVALARAIAPRPSVLLLDEPFSNLDAALRGQIRTEIHQLLVGLGITTIFVTHDQDEAFVLGDTVAVISEGRVVQVGPPAELYETPATRWLAGFVGDANFLPGVASGDVAETALGSMPLRTSHQGQVDVLVRPEHLEVEVADAAAGGVAGAVATVELVEYVGHGTSYLLDHDGLMLRAHRPSLPILERGGIARVRYVGGPAIAFDPVASAPAPSTVAGGIGEPDPPATPTA